MEWKEVYIKDICTVLGDGLHGTPEYDEKGDFYFINGNNLQEGHITIKKDTKRVSQKEFLKYQKELNDRTILVSINGTIGNVAKYNNEPCILGKSACFFNVKEDIDRNFIYYVISSPHFKKSIIQQATGTTIKNVSLKQMRDYHFLIPVNLSDQRKIAGILFALDSKIENNNKINANLEAQAQALFKSWFVDFTPFKDQPFVDSELGPIPQGWKVGKADDFYKINIGKTPPRKEKEWFSKNESDNKWISISDMGNCGLFISNSAEKLTNAAIKKFNISLVPVNTILLSFKLTIGRVAISDCDLTTNEAIARFILPDECYLEFSFLMLKLYNYSTLGSTSSIASAVNSKIIKSMKMVMPSLKVLEDFHTITNPLFEKIRFTQKENQRLAALRDTLLPKLMSGEIKL